MNGFTSFSPFINPAGAVAGYTGYNPSPDGFLRAAEGTFTIFAAPGGSGTFATGINPAGVIAGYYYTVSGGLAFHSYLRTPDGSITRFDPPGSSGCGTGPGCINPAGVIAGNYSDSNGVSHGYVRAPDGTFTTFDAPGAGTGAGQGTAQFGAAINPAAVIAGFDNDYKNVNHGFVRAKNGTITILDASGAGTGPIFQETWPFSINPAGQVAGQYSDANTVFHGFLWTPHGIQ